jgi:hypothetical protein
VPPLLNIVGQFSDVILYIAVEYIYIMCWCLPLSFYAVLSWLALLLRLCVDEGVRWFFQMIRWAHGLCQLNYLLYACRICSWIHPVSRCGVWSARIGRVFGLTYCSHTGVIPLGCCGNGVVHAVMTPCFSPHLIRWQQKHLLKGGWAGVSLVTHVIFWPHLL